MKRIALIEDDADIAYTIRLNLRKEKRYLVEHYVSGLAALAALQEKPFDLVILDLNLPDIDGLALCRELRRADETRKIPIIMLTARVEERDKLLGFDIGADDYITKPFSTQELLARIRAVLRRRAPEHVADVATIGALSLDAATHRVSWNGKPVRMGPTEFKLLHYLMKHAERVHSRTQLLDKVWGDHVFIEERTVDVHIKRLREALGDAGTMIETVRGAGYRLTAHP
jgi:two-component system phosphate regulon response regulator PhoB